MEIAREGNKYLQDKAPWHLIKDEANRQEVANCIASCLAIVYDLGKYAQVFLPNASCKITKLLNINDYSEVLRAGHSINKPELLFQKIEDQTIEDLITKLAKPEEEIKNPIKPMIQYDDFAKLDIRVGTITAAEKVEKADRLLKLSVDIGSETRTVVSGIAEHFSPDECVGKQVSYLANLAPRKLRGIESAGMILMAEDADGKLKFVSPTEAVESGSVIA
jgi:methionyl-tRNA synthetase